MACDFLRIVADALCFPCRGNSDTIMLTPQMREL
jgi:hypothetical protein